MRIGVFGGSFNPPHLMHLNIAKDLLRLKCLDKVIFVPTGNKYSKDDLIDIKYRIEMLKIMIISYDDMIVSDYENQDRVVYTYETLDYFKKKYLGSEIYFILGADNLKQISNWKNSEYILSNYKLLVINRGDEKTEVKDNVIVMDILNNDISSTFIRNNIDNDDIIKKYLDKNVLEYIRKEKLYEGCS